MVSEGYNILFGPACSGNVQAVNDERVGRVYAIQKKDIITVWTHT